MKKYDTLVIGGGPAGLFAAIQLAKNRQVVLLEKKNRPGNKLLLAGAGRCNITHTGPIENFFTKYGENTRFLRTALKEFSNYDLISFFKKRGVYSIIDKNGKVFPKSQNAEEILGTLLSECRKRKVHIQTDEAVVSIRKVDNKFIVSTKKTQYTAIRVIISTGGKSFPGTGSEGDGYKFAKQFGHTIVEPKPALTPVYVNDYKFASISGISLINRPVHLYREEKKLREHSGDIGFTHKGISGPGILDFSRFFIKGDTLKINIINTSPEILRENLIMANEKKGRQSVKNFLTNYDLPESLIKKVLEGMSIDNKTTLACLTKKMRNQIINQFCNYPFIIEKTGNFNVAMATSGGVSLKEVIPGTMESRLIKGLFFAGEVLDIDGDSGGYNIQAAFSTGALAALEIVSE